MTDIYQLDDCTEPGSVSLTEQEVAGFLAANPDFFMRNPALLGRLQVHHHERGVVSLVDIQLERLRSQIAEQEEQMAAMVKAASKNSELFERFSRTQLQLLQTHNIYQALTILESLAESLGLTVSLRLFDSFDESLYLARRSFDNFRCARLASRSVYLGRLRKKESEMLFDEPPHLGSFVVLPIGNERSIGVLSFASADGGHFQPEMDTLFVEQLAMVLTRLIHHWEYSREVVG